MRQLIEIEGVSHHFAGGDRSLYNVSFAVGAGQFVLLAGANGSGKTTLLRHLNGLLAPSRGAVRIDGLSTVEDVGGVRRRVGLVFQDADSQIVGETVYDDVAFGPENLSLERQQINQRVNQALVAVDLSGFENKMPHHLSGGEKRRLAIAGVLAMAPRVLMMDEPFSNLDYPATCRVLDYILDFHKNGHTIIITTHDLEKVIAHAQRLVVMVKGCVVKDGMPADVIGGIERYGIRPPCSVQLGQGIRPWVN